MNFSVRITVDNATGDILAVYLSIRKGTPARTIEHCDGAAMVDYSQRGDLIGIELLAPCKLSVLNKIKGIEPAIRKFVRKVTPRAMVLA